MDSSRKAVPSVRCQMGGFLYLYSPIDRAGGGKRTSKLGRGAYIISGYCYHFVIQDTGFLYNLMSSSARHEAEQKPSRSVPVLTEG